MTFTELAAALTGVPYKWGSGTKAFDRAALLRALGELT